MSLRTRDDAAAPIHGHRLAVWTAVAGLVANIVIVLTGSLVRLTGSGLGCPEWPRCTTDSFVTTPEMGIHGLIEFSNRAMGIIVGFITLALLYAAVRHGRRTRLTVGLAVGALVGVLAQGFIGGLSVTQELAPEIVAVHFLVSMVIVAAVTVLVDVLRRPDARTGQPTHREIGWLVTALPVLLVIVLVLGTVVTGSGPHAGDENARRFGLDPATMSQAHADSVLVFMGVQLAVLVALRITLAPAHQRRAAGLLLVASLVQGLIGFAQYAGGLPVPLVATHVLGAAIVTAATTNLVLAMRRTVTVGV
ncbi:COX15/CtaA family protein [Pseudonocardia sp. TRM90224]|uniref:COX15/CtaA family protein n=1 Tax=Pseudonocardia sp. TRM90224 TaxID=2812678 RepID=UPI001E4A40DD|nr:COX15/CtaA family protein [Pseudonocardia sp. TRM90224]